jgi:hypothetical protein
VKIEHDKHDQQGKAAFNEVYDQLQSMKKINQSAECTGCKR